MTKMPPQRTTGSMQPESIISSALVSALLFIAAPISYFYLEWISSQLYLPFYRYKRNFTSDLGITYTYQDEVTGDFVHSRGAYLMNRNFVLNGTLYFLAHHFLFRFQRSRTDNGFFFLRRVIALLFWIGIFLVAAVAGGPREHNDNSVIVHIIGAALTIVGGNVNSVLAGLSKGMPTAYRLASTLLGIFGLTAVAFLLTVAVDESKGMFQRASIYPIHIFDAVTAITLATQAFGSSPNLKKE